MLQCGIITKYMAKNLAVSMNDKSLIEKAYQRVWDLYNVKVTTQTYIDNYIVRQ